MIKIKRLLLVFITTIVMTFFSFCLGCSCNEQKEPEPDVPQEVPVVDDENCVWNGLRDFSLKISDADFSYSNVFATDKEGLYYDITIDDSQVAYGTKGEYIVKFIVGQIVKEQKVKIYDLPTLSIDSFTSFTYEEVLDRSSLTGLFSFVTAVDSFGVEIPVGIEETQTSETLYKQDGSVNYGDYHVTLCAVDAAGQIVKQEVSFSVLREQEKEPQVIGGDFSIDVVDETKEIELELNDYEIVACSINGQNIYEFLQVKEDSTAATLNLFNIENLKVGNDNLMRIVTCGGYSEINITLTDEKEAVMDVSGREIQTAIVGDNPIVVIPQKVYEKQNFDIELSMKSPSGSNVDISGQTFNASQSGVYTLTAVATRNGQECGKVEVKYNVYEEYNSFSTPEKREGFVAYKSIYFSSAASCGEGTYIENSIIGGRQGNFTSFQFYSSSYLGFKIPMMRSLAEIQAIKDKGVENIFVNVYITDCTEMKCSTASYMQLGNSASQAGATVAIQPETWTKLTVDINLLINNYDLIKNGDSILFAIYNGGDGIDTHENFKIYFTEVLFDLPPEAESEDIFYNPLKNDVYPVGNITEGSVGSVVSETLGGITDNWFKVEISKGFILPYFPMNKTVAELEALQVKGYTHISVPIYLASTKDKAVLSNLSGEYDWNGKTLTANSINYVDLSIGDLIANYSALESGDKVFLGINNTAYGSVDYSEPSCTVYYGTIKFVKN